MSEASAMINREDYPEPQQPVAGPYYKQQDPRRKTPFLAALLSVIPGLGQVYVGYYKQGFTNILTVGTVMSILVWADDDVPFFVLGVFFIIFFELYNIIDAARRASLYNLSLEGIEQIQLPDQLGDGFPGGLSGSYLGGGVLLLFGIIAMSNTVFGVSLEWIETWWPVAPIALGGYLVYKAYQDQQSSNESV